MSENGEDLTGVYVGIAIGNKAHAEAAAIRAARKIRTLEHQIECEIDTKEFFKKHMEVLSDDHIALTSLLAGSRSVSREMLHELQKADPSNPFLDKTIRDKIFLSTYKKVKSKTNGTTYTQRNELAEAWRNEIYGAVDTGNGGPVKSSITPNLELRAEAEVPSHTPDREKLLDIVARMSATLKNYNPNEPILQDAALLDLMNSNK